MHQLTHACVEFSLSLAGTGTPRAATFGLGAGLGVGMGYAECKFAFDSITKEATK